MRTPVLAVACFLLGAAAGFLAASSGILSASPVEQSGQFEVLAGKEGVVHFPLPYAAPPNVVLEKVPQNETMVVECTPTSFKWKNQNPALNYASASIRWISKGVR